MPIATAEAAPPIRYVIPATYWGPPEVDVATILRQIQMWATISPMPSGNCTGESIRLPRPMVAGWLPAIELRIRGSIVPDGRDSENDGRWVAHDIAEAAVAFFEATSDLLPGEPFIYSSHSGDLVGEFEVGHGSMTIIVSRNFAIVFAAVEGTWTEETISLDAATLDGFRPELQRLTEKVRTGRHAALESTN